jgi:hypothetical protein
MDEQEVKEILDKLSTSTSEDKETLELMGWTVKEYTSGEDFDVQPIQDLVDGVSSLILIGYFGGMITFHALENAGTKIDDWFDVEENYELLEPVNTTLSPNLNDVLANLGITASTKVGDTESKEYAFMQDKMIIASLIGAGGGKPFRMPKPMNWLTNFPLKRNLIERLKAM